MTKFSYIYNLWQAYCLNINHNTDDPEVNNPFATPLDNIDFDDEYNKNPGPVELGRSREKKQKAKDLYPSLAHF
jgi:hypothetical protein